MARRPAKRTAAEMDPPPPCHWITFCTTGPRPKRVRCASGCETPADVGREVGRGGWKACGGRSVLRRLSRAAPRPPTRACERAEVDRLTDAQLSAEVALSARVTGGRRQQRDARADDRQERQEHTIRVVSCRRAALVGALSRAGAAGAGLVGGESRTVSPPGLLRRVATGARRGPVARGLVGSVVSALSVSRLLRFRLRASAQLGVWAGLSMLTVAVLPV